MAKPRKPELNPNPNWKLEDWQIKSILDPKGYPVRALRWAWWTIPKKVKTEDGYKRLTHIGGEVFMHLRRYKEQYFFFLKHHNVKKDVYDTFIGEYEPEARTTW